jgi:hypothetical protein
MRLPGPRLMGLRGRSWSRSPGYSAIFSIIHGYLSGLSRPEQVVHFFRNGVGAGVVQARAKTSALAFRCPVASSAWLPAEPQEASPSTRVCRQAQGLPRQKIQQPARRLAAGAAALDGRQNQGAAFLFSSVPTMAAA